MAKPLTDTMTRRPRFEPTDKSRRLKLGVAHYLCRWLAEHGRKGFFFVQIGAHDGSAGDPLGDLIRKLGLPGLLAEPQPEVFARLEGNCLDAPGLILENAAVGPRKGTAKLYRVAAGCCDRCPDADQVASFDRELVLGHLRDHLDGQGLAPENCVEAVKVPCLTFQGLLDKHGITRFDLLQVDAEGYDFEVLKMADLSRRRPAMVNYEHKHLSEADRDQAWEMLLSLGYRLFVQPADTLAALEKF